jgi:hypothetical protein
MSSNKVVQHLQPTFVLISEDRRVFFSLFFSSSPAKEEVEAETDRRETESPQSVRTEERLNHHRVLGQKRESPQC